MHLAPLDPTVAHLLKAPRMKPIADYWEIRICPSHRGYWCAIYNTDTDSTQPSHETDTFLSRADALEIAENWVNEELDREMERVRAAKFSDE